MNRSFNRRSLLKTSGALSLATILCAYPGARAIRAQGSASYELVDLGAWDVEVGDESWGFAGFGSITDINEAGMMCGSIGVSETRASPATWSADGKLKRLKSTKGGGLGYSINHDGDVVGVEYVEKFVSRPMLWRKGERIELPLLDDAADAAHGYARDINDDGVIVGTLTTGKAGGSHAVRWIDGVAEELADPDGRLAFSAIFVNDTGTILGQLQAADDTEDLSKYVIWRGDDITILPMPDFIEAQMIIFSLGFNNNDAFLMGVHTGEGQGQWFHLILEGDKEPTVIRRDEESSLSATDINDDGDVVGTISSNGEGGSRGVLWRGDETIDLTDAVPSDAGLRITAASAINNAGMIAGQARDDDDVVHGVLLVPWD